MGSAYAGATATDRDPSYLAYNPAAVSGVDDFDYSIGLIAAWPTSDAQYSTAQTVFATPISGPRAQSDFVDPIYVPDAALRYRLSPEWSVGLGVFAPWGLSTTYDLSWAGRYHAHETKLITVDVAPTIAFQPTKELTIAASFNAQYAAGRLSNAIDIGTIGALFLVPGSVPGAQDGYGAFDAEDWGFGYTLGVLWRPVDGLAVGASYRSQIDHRLTGPVEFSIGSSPVGAALAGLGLLQNTRGATDLSTPSVVSVGATVDVSDSVSLSGELGFTDWSVFDELRVEFENPVQPDEVTLFRWKDSWFGAIGAHYVVDETWRLNVGTAYDQSPTGAFRNARIPDSDRIWIAAGADVKLSPNTTLSFSVAHLFLPEERVSLSSAETSNVFRGDLAGVSDTEANAASLQLTFR